MMMQGLHWTSVGRWPSDSVPECDCVWKHFWTKINKIYYLKLIIG